MKNLTIRKIAVIMIAASALLVAAAGPSRAAVKPGLKTLGVEVGNLAPEFTFQDLSGKWVSLSDFRGKKVFLYSWATWCTCREELPFIQDFYKKNKSDKFEIIAVASDSQGAKWVKPYLDKAGATYVSFIDPNNELAVKYNFVATQNGFLIDESGVVRMSIIGYDIRKKEHLDELVKTMKTDFKAKEQKAAGKKPADRAKELEKVVAEKPKALGARIELAEAYRMLGHLDKSEAQLREVVKAKKNHAEAHYRLGVILYQKGSVEEAVKEWEKAYKYESTNYIYMRNIESYRDPAKFYSEQ